MSNENNPGEESLAELKMATQQLDTEGFWWRPSWSELLEGRRPEEHTGGEPGEWQRGWQYWSSSVTDSHYRKITMLSGRTAARRAHLRSHSGRDAGVALSVCPTCPEFTIPSHLFRTLILERLCLPLQMTEAHCEGCHAQLDTLGRHRASCARSGRVKKRATPIERIVGRIFQEAGATVRQNVFLRDMNVDVCADDARNIEVLAQDLPCYGGVQLAVDVTLRSLLTCEGEAHAHAADMDGAMLVKARADKETAYPELATSGRCKLIVMAIETGGRWSEESVDVLKELSHAKAQEAPSFMRFQVGLLWERRWTRMLGVTCATAFAASLVEPARHLSWCHTGGKTPLLADLFESDPG